MNDFAWGRAALSVFESLRVYDGVVFKLDEHLDRLIESAHGVGISLPISRRKLKQRIVETAKRSRRRSAFLRITATGKDCWITVHPLVLPLLERYRKGTRMTTATMRKDDLRSVAPQAKTSNYLTGVLATMESRGRSKFGEDLHEVLLLNHQGFVQEGRTNNIFVVKGGQVFTPPTYGILDGVTRRTVIELCARRRLRWKETEITRHDVYVADEAFLTYTSGEIVPIGELDGRKIGRICPGPITTALRADFHRLVKNYVRINKVKRRNVA